MKGKFPSISERDMSSFSDKDIRQELKRRKTIRIDLSVIVTLVFILPIFYIVRYICEEESVLSCITFLIVVMTWIGILYILGKIKPLYTDYLKRELKKRKKKRKIQKVLSHIENHDFSKIKIDKFFQAEIVWLLVKCGGIKMTPTTEESVKVSISPSFETKEVIEINNNEILQYFRIRN